MKVLVFGDIHGGIEALRLLQQRIDNDYDLMLVAGDLSNAFFLDDYDAMVNQFTEIMSLIDSFGIPYYFTLGNRDDPLFDTEGLLTK